MKKKILGACLIAALFSTQEARPLAVMDTFVIALGACCAITWLAAVGLHCFTQPQVIEVIEQRNGVNRCSRVMVVPAWILGAIPVYHCTREYGAVHGKKDAESEATGFSLGASTDTFIQFLPPRVKSPCANFFRDVTEQNRRSEELIGMVAHEGSDRKLPSSLQFEELTDE